MDILQFILSVNKISLLAFLATLGFLSYEFYLLKKEKNKKNKPTVPKFDPASNVQNLDKKIVVVKTPQETHTKKNSNGLLIIILLFSIIILGGILGYGISGTSGLSAKKSQSKIIIQEMESKGIKIYSNQWVELKNKDIADLKQDDIIIISVVSIPGAGIDQARIKINEQAWQTNHITTNFNKSYNVFYKEYTVSSQEAKLKIDAQLHSSKDGWLGK